MQEAGDALGGVRVGNREAMRQVRGRGLRMIALAFLVGLWVGLCAVLRIAMVWPRIRVQRALTFTARSLVSAMREPKR